MRYLAGRLAQTAFLLIGVSFLTFLFSSLAPGNYFDEMRLNPQISAETLGSLRAKYQLDQPVPVRYARWVISLARGEMGYSFAYNSPVATLLWVRTRNTLLLTLTATLIAWMVALPLGVWGAETRGRLPDRLLSLVSVTLLAIPDLVLALTLLILAARSGWLPTGGLVSVDFDGLTLYGKIRDLARHMALPVSASLRIRADGNAGTFEWIGGNAADCLLPGRGDRTLYSRAVGGILWELASCSGMITFLCARDCGRFWTGKKYRRSRKRLTARR